MHVGDDTVGFVAEFKGRKGPAWRRALDMFAEASRRRAAAREALKVPKELPDVKVHRSRLEVSVEARMAVRSGIRLEDFLRNRLAKYAARLPVALEDLPVTIDIDGGEPVVRSRAAAQPATPNAYGASYSPSYAPQARPEEHRWMRSLVEREGPFAAQEIHEAEAALAALDQRVAAARDRAEQLARTLADDLAAGKVPAPAAVDATPEQLGRPPVPAHTPATALRTFVLALVVAEAFFFSGPILGAQGVDPTGIVEALRASPVPVAMAVVFALGAAAAVFAFASVSLARLAQLDGARERPGSRGTLLAAALVAALLTGGVTAAATNPSRLAHVALLAIVPFAGALLLRAAARLQVARDAALQAALAWDRALAQEVSARARRLEIVEQARAEVDRLEAERAESRRRLRALEQRAVTAERAASERTRREARRLERLAESLAGALELDRYAFLRLATEAAHDALVRPVRRIERSSERLGIAG